MELPIIVPFKDRRYVKILIDKIKVLDSQKIEDDFERLLRAHFAEGKIEHDAFKHLLAVYQKQQEKSDENTPKS